MSESAVSAIVVSYNVRDLLLACVQALENARCADVLDEIIVVDNASRDGSPDTVRQRFHDVTVIDASNRGYGAGANVGINASNGRYLLILNPDTVVPAGTIDRLADHLDNHPDVAIAAPRMRYPDGKLQPSRRRFPARFTPVFESTVFHQWWPDNPWARHYYLTDRPEKEIQEVDWVVGACLMVRRDALDRVGGFDEMFWMYCEEIEWCWRFHRHGWTVSYIPDVEIIHHEGASTIQNVPRRQLAFDSSRIELQRRLYGRPTAFVNQAGIKLGYLMQLIIESGKWALGHRRNLRRTRIQFYACLLGSSMHFDGNQQP